MRGGLTAEEYRWKLIRLEGVRTPTENPRPQKRSPDTGGPGLLRFRPPRNLWAMGISPRGKHSDRPLNSIRLFAKSVNPPMKARRPKPTPIQRT